MKSKIVRRILLVIPMFVTMLYGACTPRASTQGEVLWNQLDRIKAISLADNIIYQTDIPITLSTPGTYSLGEDIVSTNATAPITIASDAITLDLQGYTVSQGPTATTGIQASGGTIKNGTVAGFTVGAGGSTSFIEDITFEDCGIAINQLAIIRVVNCVSYNCGSFYNLNAGGGGINASINNCSIHNCTGDAISCTSASGFTVVDCTIAGSGGNGITFTNVTTGSILRCIVSDTTVHGIQVVGAGGLDVSECKITNVLTGDGINSTVITTLFQDCTIEHVVAGNGINLAGGQNIVIYSCSISDVAGTGVIDNTGGTSWVYNTFLANVGTAFSGGSPTQKSQTDVTNNTTNFWQNVVV